ncbi:LACT-domain-containing protein [Peniophora sp. CONT]|nr:LACT-domain-containing protein [Peniophora sp. CONT]
MTKDRPTTAVEKRAKSWSDPATAQEEATAVPGVEDEVQELRDELAEEVRGLKKAKHKKDHGDKRKFYAMRRFIFPFGLFLGSLLVIGLSHHEDLHSVPADLALLLNNYDFSLTMPSMESMGIDFSRVEEEWNRLTSQIPEPWKLNNDGREFKVGEALLARGLSAEHPVVMIPGVISTGLESWSTSPEYRQFFKQRVWGGFSMLTQVTFNREKWMTAMLLDPVTGLDPPGVKVRAAEGLDAASSFIQGYWIWSKIIENLAVVDYDTNNMYLAAYDWRVSMYNLEVRDAYYTRLKSTIEMFKKKSGKKVVVASHSMGATVYLYFMKWVEHPDHGGGGSTWIEDHVDSWITVSGTHLGVAKAMSAFMSGEMKDTVQMNPAGEYVLDRFFSKQERRRLFRSWAGSASMWIKGGDAIWGNGTHAPDDPDGSMLSHGSLVSFREDGGDVSPGIAADNETAINRRFSQPYVSPTNMTSTQAGAWILEHTPTTFQKMMETNYSNGIEYDEEKLIANDNDPRMWSNPLESRLPYAPSMKIYCVYGHGKDTERSYWYKAGAYEQDDVFADAGDAVCGAGVDCDGQTPRTPLDLPLSRDNTIDKDYSVENSVPRIQNGVKIGEGDGTVSLLSMGAMCAGGWKHQRWNPANIPVVTVELPHKPISTIPRGGANTSDHVDILGSQGVNEIILKVAVGAGDEVEDSYVSRIREYVRRIVWDP